MKNETNIGRITVGGQPESAELAQTRFGAVINLRLPSEEGNTTAESVAGTGVAYHEVPLTAETLTADHVRRVREAVDAATGDVLVH